MKKLLVLVLIAAAGSGVGCSRPAAVTSPLPSKAAAAPEIPEYQSEVVDQLVRDLSAEGLTATITAGPQRGQGAFFNTSEYMVKVDGAVLRVYSYDTAERAAKDAAAVRSDGLRPDGMGGSSVGTSVSPSYMAPAHFFRKDKAIVLYLAASADRKSGVAARVIEALTSLLGPEFAKSGS